MYKARHRLLERDFAIKVFHPSFSEGGRSLARFFQEARMLFDLNHPSIIRVHNVGMVVKRPFIVMELFDGTDLNASLKENGAMPPSKAIALIRMVLEGVHFTAGSNGVKRKRSAARPRATCPWRPCADGGIDRVLTFRRAGQCREAQHIGFVIARLDRADRAHHQFIHGQCAGLIGAQHIDHGRLVQRGQPGQQDPFFASVRAPSAAPE